VAPFSRWILEKNYPRLRIKVRPTALPRTLSAILDFWKSKILTAVAVRMVNISHHADFRADRLNHCRDMAIFQFCFCFFEAYLELRPWLSIPASCGHDQCSNYRGWTGHSPHCDCGSPCNTRRWNLGAFGASCRPPLFFFSSTMHMQKNQGQRSVGSKYRVETNGWTERRTDTTVTLPLPLMRSVATR